MVSFLLPADTPLSRKSELELAKRLQLGALVHSLAVCFFAFGTATGRANPAQALFFIGLLLTTGTIRTLTSIQAIRAPHDWLLHYARRLHLAFFLHLAAWLAYLSYVFYKCFGQVDAESILIICIAGTTSSGSNVLAPARWLALIHFLSQMAVCLVWSVYATGHFSSVILVAVICYTILQTIIIEIQCRHTKGMFETQIRMEAASAELAKSRDAAEQQSQARARFLATMSHEIRTPLNGLLGLAQILGDTPLNAEQREVCETMGRSGEHLRSIVDDILDYSKAVAGRMELETIPFDLHGLLLETKGTIKPLAAQKDLEFRAVIDPATPRYVEGDPVRLRQILLNLLGNSIKFTNTGSVELRACLAPTTGQILLSVEDTGIGIAPENLELLFRDFTQLDSSAKRRFGGTGLGLAITKHLVQLMSGTISVVSESGRGARFDVMLPLKKVSAPAGGNAIDAMDLAGCGGLPAGFRILVAEDNRVNQRVAQAILSKTGAFVDLASNGAEAVRKHAEQPFHFIFMDCNMPEMDGFEATSAIRAMDAPLNGVPIVALTANAFGEDRDRCFAVGMNGHLAKPVRKESLYSTLLEFAGTEYAYPRL